MILNSHLLYPGPFLHSSSIQREAERDILMLPPPCFPLGIVCWGIGLQRVRSILLSLKRDELSSIVALSAQSILF